MGNFLYFFMVVSLLVGCGGGNTAKLKAEKNNHTSKLHIMESKSVSSFADTTPSATKIQKLAIPKNGEIYFGAYASFGDDENNVTEGKVEDFEKKAGKKITWVYFSNSWKNGIYYPRETIQKIDKMGKIPFIRFMPRRTDKEDIENKTMIMQDIIDGKFDESLKLWAQAAKRDNIPLLMDFALEMTGEWMGWNGKWQGGFKLDGYGDPTYPDGPERFRDAYRHIITLFRDEGVNHITWFFHPDIQRMPDEEYNSAKYYYPGDAYIDWIGLSVYGVQFAEEYWKTFSRSLEEGFTFIKEISQTKPLAILEFGITDDRKDGSKSQWLKDAFADILGAWHFKFSAFIYWNEDWENRDGTMSRLSIDSSKESLDAFRKGIQDPRFISKTIFN